MALLNLGSKAQEFQHVKRHECGHTGVFIEEVILLSGRRGGKKNEPVFKGRDAVNNFSSKL